MAFSIPSAKADRCEAANAIVMYPADSVPDRASGNPDTSLLCLIDIRTMVMSGVAAQHVQPLSSKPF
jgi:hypothetical protein